jgi:hypothetical protein
MSPSIVERIVVPQDRRYQMDICHSASAKPANAIVPTKRNTTR